MRGSCDSPRKGSKLTKSSMLHSPYRKFKKKFLLLPKSPPPALGNDHMSLTGTLVVVLIY